MMNLWNGSSKNGSPRRGVPSNLSPCWWQRVFSIIWMQNSGALVSSQYSGFSRSLKNLSTACFNSTQATFRPSLIDSAYSRTAGQFLALFDTRKDSCQPLRFLFLRGVSRHFLITSGRHPKFSPVRQGGLVQIVPLNNQRVLHNVGATTIIRVLQHRNTPFLFVLFVHSIPLRQNIGQGRNHGIISLFLLAQCRKLFLY